MFLALLHMYSEYSLHLEKPAYVTLYYWMVDEDASQAILTIAGGFFLSLYNFYVTLAPRKRTPQLTCHRATSTE